MCAALCPKRQTLVTGTDPQASMPIVAVRLPAQDPDPPTVHSKSKGKLLRKSKNAPADALLGSACNACAREQALLLSTIGQGVQTWVSRSSTSTSKLHVAEHICILAIESRET